MRWQALTSTLAGALSVPVVVEVRRDAEVMGSAALPIIGLEAEEGAWLVRTVSTALGRVGFACDWTGLQVTVTGRVHQVGDLGLALAAALLAATKQGSAASLASCLYLGGVATDGTVSPARGILAHLSYARTHGLTLVCGVAPYVSEIPWNCRRIVHSVTELRFCLEPQPGPIARLRQADDGRLRLVSEVRGCAHAKRAACVALTGGHTLGLVCERADLVREFVSGMQEMALPLPVSRRREVALARSVAGLERGFESAGVRPLAYVGGTGPGTVPAEYAHALARHGILVIEGTDDLDDQFLSDVLHDPRVLVVVVVTRDEVRRQTSRAQRLLACVDIACVLSEWDMDARMPGSWNELAELVREGSAFAARRNARAFEDPSTCVDPPYDLVRRVVDARGLTLSKGRYRVAVAVARTIADLTGSDAVTEAHVTEALVLVMGGACRT